MAEKYPVVEGAEPFFFEGNNVGILVVHGFTGSTQSMRTLGEAYAKAGYTVCGPRLAGHGTHYEDMEQTTYHDWIDSVKQGYQWLKERCDTIFVTGLSMGGTLSLYMAETVPDIQGMILINAAVDIPEMTGLQNLQPIRFLDEIGSDIKKPGVEELAYEKTPVKSIKELVMLMKLVRDNLDNVACPALIFVSEEDHVVPPDNGKLIYDKILSDEIELMHLKNSYHVATLDNDQQIIIEKALQFIEQTKNL